MLDTQTSKPPQTFPQSWRERARAIPSCVSPCGEFRQPRMALLRPFSGVVLAASAGSRGAQVPREL
eukprot:8354415-Pyramimonas_sp.AAC.1